MDAISRNGKKVFLTQKSELKPQTSENSRQLLTWKNPEIVDLNSSKAEGSKGFWFSEYGGGSYTRAGGSSYYSGTTTGAGGFGPS